MMYFSISFLLKVCLISQCVVVFKLSEASKDIGFKRQVFENVVTEIECCKCQEKIKVNPFDMLNYIHGAKTMKEENGKLPHLNAEPSQPSDAIQIQSKLYFQRFVNLLLLASGLKNFNMESSYKIVSMEFNITYQDLKLLQDFANKGTIHLERIDGVLSRILRQKNVKTTHKREGFLADVDFVYYSKVVLTFLATLPVDYPMVCIAFFVSMVFIVTVRHMRRYTLFYSIVLMLFIIFCAGFGWNWLRMIKEEEAKIASTYALHLNQLPIHCRPHDMTWLDRIWYYSYEKDCEKYFKEISIDPVVRISPTLVLSETITMMFLHPFGKIGTAFGEFLAALIEPIPFAHKWYLVPLVLVLIFVTFFLSYLVLIGGVISFKTLLGSVEIGRRESRNAGGLPRLDSFGPARQMIENVPREEVGGGGGGEGGGGGLRRIEGERVREEEGVERRRGDSGGRGGEREENWRGGNGEGEGERRLRLEEGREREENWRGEGGGEGREREREENWRGGGESLGGGGGRERKREENWRGEGESGVGGGEERRLKVQEGSERDENRRGRGGEGRLRRIEGEREMEEDNGGRRFGLQEVREREGNEGGGDNLRERGKTEENVGEKRDEGWLSEIRRRIGWGGRSGENEGEERRRIERGGSDWNEREGGRKVETQEKEVESSGGRRTRIGEEKDGGRRVERERGGGRVLDEGGSGDSPKGRERVGDRRRGGGEGWNEEENRQGDGGTCDKCGGEGRIMRREEEEGGTVKNVGEKGGRGERVEEEGGQKGGVKNCEVERRLEERREDLGEVRCVENQAENSKSVEKIRDKVGGNLKKPIKGENEESGSSAKKNVGEGEQEVGEEEEEFNLHFSPKAYKELKTIYKRFKTIVTSNDQDDDDDDDDDDSENDAPDISGVEKLKKRTKS